MSQRFEFATAGRIVFGAGVLQGVGAQARAFGRRALVVTGADPGRAEILLAALRESGVDSMVYSISGEPETATVERGVALARDRRCELVISFGGGSPLDGAKAIAAMLNNEGELLDYLEVIGRGKSLARPSAPFIAIPTTAGTGSEVTRNAVLASPGHGVKVSLRSPLMLPAVALIDPELTYDLPPAITASTGLDALTQVIEPYVSSRSNPMTDPLCVEGIKRVGRSLRVAFSNGRDPAAREDMSLAALFGGLALANAGLGAVHGFAGPIGGMFSAPHGTVCATLLRHVMAANLRALRMRAPDSVALGRYDEVARILTGNPAATAEAGVEWVRGLVADLQVPGLRNYGIGPEHVDELVEKAGKASSMKANPISLTREELSEILVQAL
jgi:alcohol dehydrogenase class IV